MSENDDNLLQDSVEYKRWKTGGVTGIVHLCPRGCKEPLESVEVLPHQGMLSCAECDGVKASVDLIAEDFRGMFKKNVKEIILDFIRKGKEEELICPMCDKKMYEVEMKYDQNQVKDFEFLLGGPYVPMPSGDMNPILILIGAVLFTANAVHVTGHLTKLAVSSLKKKNTSSLTLDGCANCESLWFDGEKYSNSETSSYNHELLILERFWASSIKFTKESQEKQKKVKPAKEVSENKEIINRKRYKKVGDTWQIYSERDEKH